MSGGGAGRAAAESCAGAFRVAGHAPELAPWLTDGPGADELARRAAESGAERVVAVGGDGTALDVAAGLLEAAGAGGRGAPGVVVPMAHVPRGTANVLALNLAIPRSLAGAIATAVEGVEARIDVGTLRAGAADREPRVDDAPFLLSVGTGLHAEIVARADRSAKRRWGVLAYLWAGWDAVRQTPSVRYRVTVDGEDEEIDATMIQVMNCGAVLRRSWAMGPGISPVDGELDVLVYRARTRREYVGVGARVVGGTPTATALVRHLRGSRVRLTAEAGVGVQRDGEPAGSLPVEIGVRPAALPVLVPPASPWAGKAA